MLRPISRSEDHSMPRPISRSHSFVMAAFLVALLPVALLAQTAARTPSSADSASVAATVRSFHGALQTGDTATVKTLLAADARVGEGGGLETRAEYLSHHLPGDMAYAAKVSRTVTASDVTLAGDVAWVMSTTRTTGQVGDRAIDVSGVELMVLGREQGVWRIRAIQWSAGRNRQ